MHGALKGGWSSAASAATRLVGPTQMAHWKMPFLKVGIIYLSEGYSIYPKKRQIRLLTSTFIFLAAQGEAIH